MYTLIDALPRFLRHWRWWHAISGLAFSQKKVSVRESARLFCTTSVRKASQLCSFFPILIPKGKCTCLASRLSRRRCPRKATRYPLRLDFHRGVNSCLGAQRRREDAVGRRLPYQFSRRFSLPSQTPGRSAIFIHSFLAARVIIFRRSSFSIVHSLRASACQQVE